ncbi:hypothetical protein BC939DRAFT_452661 [Gamsiella multidivaricata]|uniref:uncharacterized protein n=1 Tax=Gamsiella multidivaricata TaxID=101098 RepID=UPI00221E9442|nr:uncharacterized protein BC939DRAFT_452661 [Gamsiella multidivaricata]KAI7823060.1 hypothetical protein BC939DRAFT_452661 [Gamsiella multidivaricata]
MRRLGPNLLSSYHHRFLGLDETDGHQSLEHPAKRLVGSPFPDVYAFLVFCLKAACVLEALQRSNMAHLALCPTAFHWAPPDTDITGPVLSKTDGRQKQVSTSIPQPNPSSLYHVADSTAVDSSVQQHGQDTESVIQSDNPSLSEIDLNKTRLRLFDFTHSKILSHERARAPNNIFEWQIPGYLEYHLQYLAPEQTGRAETWMDHRTDIYGLGTTLFSLLTMQFPNRGNDSVQILQGVLSIDLPPLGMFRPDMPPIIDDILRKMTRKQPSQRYQNAFGFKQDILRCLNELHRTGTIKSFPLGKYDISCQFVLPNTVFGRHVEQQMISAAISQAASACKHSLNNDSPYTCSSEDDNVDVRPTTFNDSDHYVFEDDIVSLQRQACSKIPLSSKTLLRTPKPFDGGKSVPRGSEATDSVVRAIFVSGPSGVGKTVLIRGMAMVARNSGLFAGGVFEAEGSEPYSAIISCIQSVLQQLLTQHTEALASLVVAIRTAFGPNSGIGIVCDLVPELKYFFRGSEMSKSKDVPLTHSIARFHALILKLIRVISTHFFMTWLIDDIHYADENSIALLATLVNVSKRLPIVLIMTHRDTVDCLIKVKQILGGRNVTGAYHTGSYEPSSSMHHDPLVHEISDLSRTASTSSPMTQAAAIRTARLPLVVRGGGGVRFIRLLNPTLEAIQEFLGVLLHRSVADVLPLAIVLHQKSWLTIRQLVLELHRNRTIYFDHTKRVWDWESCPETLADVVRKLTGEEYAFLESRFRALDCDTKKTLICAAICGSVFTIHDLQHLASTAYVWIGRGPNQNLPPEQQNYAPETIVPDSNNGSSAMAGLQSALSEGILVYTSITDVLRWHHNVMRRVALGLLEGTDEKERLHYEMVKILVRSPGQEFRAATHLLQCIDLAKKKITPGLEEREAKEKPYWVPVADEADQTRPAELDARILRAILTLAGERSQKTGAQDKAMEYWDAAMLLLPNNCWDPYEQEDATAGTDDTRDGQSNVRMESKPEAESMSGKLALYQEALKLHMQCIEAQRWLENFDRAMEIGDGVLAEITDPIDRARVYQHQIELFVWAYSRPEQATILAIRCLQELGLSKDVSFCPTQQEIRELYNWTHFMLMDHMAELEAEYPKQCTDLRIIAMMEVLSTANATLYYNNVPFLAAGIAQAIKLVCENGITNSAGRAIVSFALTHATWHGCLDKVYELGKLACKLCKDNHHVKLLFNLTVQQWGDHVANSIPALEEILQDADLACDRLFHTAGMIHVSMMRILLGRVHLRDCMAATMDLIAKHTAFGPKSHGVEVIHGSLQLIKCLKGETHSNNPETIFDDNEFAESKIHGKRDKALVMVHNNNMYLVLKVVAAFVFGHYAYINKVTTTWHDDPKSMMNFDGSWISHWIFTVIGLTLVNLLRNEKDPEAQKKMRSRLLSIRDKMAIHAAKYPTNHAAMFHLLEAEIADQAPEDGTRDLESVLLLYEKAIAYATEGDFPLHQCFAFELAAKCHLRHGLVTSARCLMANACKGYQNWGARGKVLWFHKVYPQMFGSLPDAELIVPARGLFYRPNEADSYLPIYPLTSSGPAGSGTLIAATLPPANGTSSWLSSSPKTMYSPSNYGNDAVSAAATAMAESCMVSSVLAGSASSVNLSTGSLHQLQSNSLASPQSPEMDSTDLDVLDFSSVIEAMQVIASEIDLDLLLVKSLGVLNQSVGAKRCCVMISKDQDLVLAASQGAMGRCEAVNPPMKVSKCSSLFHGIINYVVNTSALCLLTNAKDDPRFCADDYLKRRADLKTVLCAPILHKAGMVGVLYMEDFPERAFANKRMLVMNLLVQQLGISITNALLYQSVLRSETKLNGLLENMPCGIALWDATAENCQYINSSWRDMTGFTVDEIMDSGWEILTHKDEVTIYAQHWHERVQAGVPCQWESRYKLKDGSFRWAIVRMLPIKSPPDNKIIQWLTVTIDIDDQRRAVQLKSNFLANMSHELRTPFSGILGMLSLLRDSSGLSHEQFEFVDMAKASCEMLIRIVDDLLNFSKLEADKVTLEHIPLCFEEILGDVCDLLVPLASRKGLELIILFDDALPLILIGDPDRIKQILMNLIGNAIKFSSTGNVVVEFWHERIRREDIIRYKNEKSSQNVLALLAGKKTHRQQHDIEVDDLKLGDEITLHCTVKDQGIGMTPEEQKMLFVSFQQTDNGTTRKYGGTGLGLSICSQLIAHMQGKITVESEKGKGATFAFTAKLRTDTVYDEEQSPAEAARLKECSMILTARLEAIKQKTVLILSPNRQLRQQIVRTLKGTICAEYDTMASALASGAIMMTEESIGSNQPDNMSIDNSEHHMGAASRDQNAAGMSWGGISTIHSLTQFDFILIDHVLDSAELDRIYPSPAVAFVLLLAPTTETLRWILPPATRKSRTESEEPESAQVDIGGRGRICRPLEVDCAPGKTAGRVQRITHEMSAQQNHAALANIAGSAVVSEATIANKPASVPSQLFKKRKSRGQITVARPIPHSADTSSNGVPRLETTTFQVYRMIKPVRRMKLLQILYNALNQHGQTRKNSVTSDVGRHVVRDGEHVGQDGQSFDYDNGQENDRRRRHSLDRATSLSTSSSPSTFSSYSESPQRRSASPMSTSSSSEPSSSLKRRRDQATLDILTGGELKRRYKTTLSDPELPTLLDETMDSLDPVAEKEPLRNLGLSGTLIGVHDGNMPRRARNNDALTLLLTSEQRESCRGKNVLVAEDDFVSQKILEKQLSKLGMNVFIANNGQEAVDEWLSVELGHYAIAIFDHHMPIMDGLAATRKVRAFEAEFAQDQKNGDQLLRIPIVGLSADIQQSTKESCIKAGMDEYMTKPLLTKGLALLIQHYCCN